MKSKNPKWRYLIVLLVILGGVVFAALYKGNRNPLAGEITGITITQEFPDTPSIEVEDVEAFIEKLEVPQWEKARDYELKFAPQYFLKLQPGEKTVEILGEDGRTAYARINGKYYRFPLESYRFIQSVLE